jgi:hypothetical protein
LLAPLNAVFQDVQKQLQMELDVERVVQADEGVEHKPIESPLSNATKFASKASGTIEQDAHSNLVATSLMPTSISQQREAFAFSNTQPAFENPNVLLEITPSYFNKQPIEQAKLLPSSSFKTTEQETPTEPTLLVPITNSSITPVESTPLASTPLLESSKSNTVLETAKQPAELPKLSLTSGQITRATISSKTIEQARTNPIIAAPSAVIVDKPINLAHAQKLFESSNINSATEITELATTASNNRIVGISTLPLTPIAKEIEQTATDTTPANETKPTIPASAASNEAINPVSTQHLFESPNLNSMGKTSALANTVSATTLDNNPTVGRPSTLTPINKEIERTETGTTLSNETKFTVPESVALNEVKPVPLTPIATKLEPVAVNNQSATTTIETDLPSPSASTAKAFTARSTPVSSPDMMAQQPAVLIPLRNEATPNSTAPTTNANALPSVTANRLEAAVDPALQQAYQVTQQQLQTIEQDANEAQSSGLVRNTFNVSVAMNNNNGSDSIDLSDFEQALTEVLRIAARRQGLEV